MTVPILVFTSDYHMHALRPFAYLFNRYWRDAPEVDVIGFARPNFFLPNNFSFHSIGSMHHYPVKKWTNGVLDALRNFQASHFVLMLEDYWIREPVDDEAVQMLYEYCQAHPEVIKMDLCADRMYAGGVQDYGSLGHLDLVKSDYNSPYHMSLMTGIWNKELFTRFVLPDQSPWDVEIDGTSYLALAKDEVLVLGTKQWPVHHTLGIRNGKYDSISTDGLEPEDISNLKQLGFVP